MSMKKTIYAFKSLCFENKEVLKKTIFVYNKKFPKAYSIHHLLFLHQKITRYFLQPRSNFKKNIHIPNETNVSYMN